MRTVSATATEGYKPLQQGELNKFYQRRSDDYMVTNVENLAVAVAVYVIDAYLFKTPRQYAALMSVMFLGWQRLTGLYMQCIEARNKQDAETLIRFYEKDHLRAITEDQRQRTVIMMLWDERIAEMEASIEKSKTVVALFEGQIRANNAAMRLVNTQFSFIDTVKEESTAIYQQQSAKKTKCLERLVTVKTAVSAKKAYHIKPDDDVALISTTALVPMQNQRTDAAPLTPRRAIRFTNTPERKS